jgi:hypothetical protein
VFGTQALAGIYLEQPDWTKGLLQPPGEVLRKVSRDAAAAQVAGVEALLVHEASLKRGPAIVRCTQYHFDKHMCRRCRNSSCGLVLFALP